MVKNFFQSLFDWLKHDERQALEAYLSQAANQADVDRLMRQWENRHKSFPRLP